MNQYFTTIILILLFFTPFISINCIFDGDIWGAYYYIMGLGSIVIITNAFFFNFREGVLKLRISIVDFFTFLLTVYIALRFLMSPNQKALVPYFYTLIIYIIILKFFTLTFNRNQKRLLTIIFIFFLVGVIEGLYGILQHLGLITSLPNQVISGTFNNPGPYSNFLVMILIFASGFYLYFKPSNNLQNLLRYFALITSLVIFTILPFTKARTSWLASIIGFVVIIWPRFRITIFYKVMFGNQKRRILSISVLLIFLFAIFTFLYQFKQNSAKGRLLIYEVCFDMIKDKPFFGHGFGTFIVEYNNYQANFFKDHPNNEDALLADNIKVSFNEFVQITVELGITGLLLFIALIFFILKSKPKKEFEYIAIPAKGAFFAALICFLFSYPLHSLPVTINIVFILIMIMVSTVYKEHIYTIGKLFYKPFAIFASIISIIVCCLQWKDFEARKQWKQAIDYTQIQNYEKALPYYQEAYKVLNNDGFFLYNYGSILLDFDAEKGVKILEEATIFLSDSDLYVYLGDGYRKLKDYAKSEKCYFLASNMVPCKFFPRYQLFKLYCETAQYSKAYTIAQNIAEMKVKVPSVIVFAIKDEINQWLKNQKNEID